MIASRYLRVELRNVRLALGDTAVLRGVDWTIAPGQRWLLTGANGSGKTQLLKLVAGDVWPTPRPGTHRRYLLGQRSFDEPYGVKQQIAYVGAERQDRYEHYAWNHRVASVVGTGLHRTDIPLDPLTAADRARIARLLRRLQLAELESRRFLSLSYGERRLVLIARALAWRPRLLLLDEIFNGLDTHNRERVRRVLGLLSRSALPWVLSTHRPQDAPVPVTHHAHLERGRLLERRGSLAAAAAAAVRRQCATPSIAVPSAPAHVPRTRHARADGAALFLLRRVDVWRGGACVLRSLSLTIRAHECWVVHGPNGGGKSSLIQLLYGDLSAADGGHLERAGMGRGVPVAQFKARVGLVAPELQAMHPRTLPVEAVVASGLSASIGVHAVPTRAARARVKRALRRVAATALAARRVRALSYGQLRRVLFARALVHEPDILLLDEPYAGLDARTRANLQELVDRTVEAGRTVIIVTHHREEWPRGVSHELQLDRAGRGLYCGPLRA